MCNAHKHPPGCNCGWGGGHSRGRYSWRSSASIYSGARHLPAWLTSVFPNTVSYTNPNARCPVCGDNVFFYQSPHGGRVYFDELGPPWPKHPCTDQTTIPDRPFALPQNHTYSWQKQGWTPFEVKKVRAEAAGLPSLYFTVIEGTTPRIPITVHVIEPSFYERIHENEALIFSHVKPEFPDEVSISFLDNNNDEFKVRGFFSLSAARQEHDRQHYRAPKKPKITGNSNSLGKALIKAMGKLEGKKE